MPLLCSCTVPPRHTPPIPWPWASKRLPLYDVTRVPCPHHPLLRPQVQFLRSARGMGGIISATTFGDTTAFYRAYFAAVERAITAARQAAGAPLPAPLPLAHVGRGAAAVERGAAPASED